MKFWLPSAVTLAILVSLMTYLPFETSAMDSTMPMRFSDSSSSGRPGAVTGTVIQRIEQRQVQLGQKLQDMTQKLASREAALKLRLQQFKDQKKASKVSDFSSMLNKINQNRTDMMVKHLDLMGQILDKVDKRVTEASSSGQNTASASAVLVSARTAVTTARNAVIAQSQKDYTIDVSSESTARNDAKVVSDKLHADLLSTYKLVTAAKQAVISAIRSPITSLKAVPTETNN